MARRRGGISTNTANFILKIVFVLLVIVVLYILIRKYPNFIEWLKGLGTGSKAAAAA